MVLSLRTRSGSLFASSALGSADSQRRRGFRCAQRWNYPLRGLPLAFLRVWRRRLGLERFLDRALLLLGRHAHGC